MPAWCSTPTPCHECLLGVAHPPCVISSPQVQPDTVSPTLGLGEDDDDPLLEEGEVDMRAMMVAGGVMKFELLRLPPQSKTVGLWTFQQGGRGKVVCILASHLSHMYTMCESCMQNVMCLH